MATEPTITLYDLAFAADSGPSSPNVWQTRLALNYKGLPYKTVWLHLTNVKPTLQSIGAAPTPYPAEPGGVLYTVPAVVDTSAPGKPAVITGILAIAEYLDETYPERPIFPRASRALLTFYHNRLVQDILFSMIPLILAAFPRHIPECDRAYFRETRERWLGSKLEDLSPPGSKREAQMEKLRSELDSLAVVLAINGEGEDLIMGNQPSVGDFALIAFFMWLSIIAPDEWDMLQKWNEGR